jgi:hypothetical protein
LHIERPFGYDIERAFGYVPQAFLSHPLITVKRHGPLEEGGTEMALRREDLDIGRADAALYRFPTAAVRARAARQQRAMFLRRRIGVGALLVTVVLLGIQIGGVGNTAPTSVAGAPRAVRLHTGETLWDVAARFAPPSVDTRAYVDELIELNGLSGAPAAGAKIRLPN